MVENGATEENKRFVEQQLQENEIDIILSHTCPRKYEPREAFLTFIDQSTVDTSTEDWLDSIEEKIRSVVLRTLAYRKGYR